MGSGLNIPFKVLQCSQCQGNAEFYCNTCKHDLCLHCKERHVIDINTIYHDVVIYREKYECISKQENCMRHPGRIYEMFCLSCKRPVCFQCTEHRIHNILDIETAYKINRRQRKEILHNIRSEILYSVFLYAAEIKADIKNWRTEISNRQSEMLEKAQALKDLVDTMMSDFKIRCFMINRLQQQKDKMNRHLARMKDYEQQYEQLANRPVKFLLFLENNSVSKIMGTPKVTQHALLSLPDEIKMEDVIRQGKIQITEIGKRQITKECVLKMMSTPVLHKSVTMKCRRHVYHISYVTSDRIWISDNHTLIMTNTEGEDLHRREISSYIERFGQHTVNGTGELVFIDKNHNITKLSTENNTTSTVINIMGPRRPECVYCSPSSGDLLVGMYKIDSNTYELNRFSSTGQHKQTIAYSTTGQELYSKPLYITENRNGDIIVSDWYYGVVVTDERGKHRFTYTGPLSGSPLYPCGICSDALSHILVCDIKSNTVQMIDKDGHFLSLILTEQQGIYKPRALCYDYKSHLLWVGSYNDSSWKNSKLLVYRYINRQDLLAGICIW